MSSGGHWRRSTLGARLRGNTDATGALHLPQNAVIMRTPATPAVSVLATVAALALSSCGGDGEGSTAPQRTASPPQGTAPQSAGETVRGAPDQPIEDRPGGPGSEGHAKQGSTVATRPPSPTDRRLIERTVRRYVSALDAHDGGAVCALLAPGALEGVRLPEHRGTCASSLNASIGHPPRGGAPRWLHTQLVGAGSIVLVQGG